MKRKAVSGIMLTLILISMLTLAFNIQLVRAVPTTWTVDDDGGADFTSIQAAINAASPGDTIFVYNGTYYEHPYVMNKDDLTIVGENKNNTIIDGSGFGAVLRVYYAENVAVRGFRVQNGGWGLYYDQGSGIFLGHWLRGARSCNISDNIVSNSRYGISLGNSMYNTIKGNTISDANQGISFDVSRDNTVVGNTISNGVQVGSDPPYGIQAWESNDNTIVGNVVTNISYTGIRLTYATGNVVTGNIVSNTSVGISASFEASSNTIIGNNVSQNEVGIEVWNSNYNTITLNEISNNPYSGIRLTESSNNTISGNNITANSFYGISLDWSSNNNAISGNSITNSFFGIVLYKSSNNGIHGNNIIGDWNCMYLYCSSHNSISGNNIANADIGIQLDGDSNHNSIFENNITANTYFGIMLAGTLNNSIYHNNFVDNTEQVNSYISANVWDDGYLSGGNYWSDYTGVDANSDGIGDTPYVIDANNQDRYPLMEPWSPTPTIPTMIKALVRTVLFWNLPKGTENSLTSKLKGALHLLDKGNENGAIHKLMDLIDQAEALRGKKLTNEQADQLISEAQKIIDLIEE